MTLSISEVRDRVAARFPDVEEVDDSVLRFTRRAGKAPFAVYYLDIAQDLPGTPESLTKYQDRVIGSHYFEGTKSLQWSNYVYFVTTADRLASSEVRKAKDLIEGDRSYARKFVISEEELDSVLTPVVIAPADATPRANVLSVWIDRLVEAGLDGAILSDEDLPTRLTLIESSTGKPRAAKVPRRTVDIKPAPFIRSLQLKEFREFPLIRNFNFGAVNLIFGPNGSGKTCLLEAIELFYCGRNKRNPTPTHSYELAAVLADGRMEKATANRSLQTFRDRNLAWYGQSEVKTTHLYQSFAQFNFLDTDAAVRLSESATSIEEDLSKLLVGPDASKTWRDIERVHDAVAGKLRELRPVEMQIKEELAVLAQRQKEAADIAHESDAIRARLESMIRRIGWGVAQGDNEKFAASLVESLSELVPVAQQAVALAWVSSPVSNSGLVEYCREAKVTTEKADAALPRLEVVRRNLTRLAEASKRGGEALKLAKQAMQLVDAGVPVRATDISNLQSAVATHSGWLAGLEENALAVFSGVDLDAELAAHHDSLNVRRATAEKLLVSSQEEYASFAKLRDQSLNLAQELREIAAKILKNSAKPDECPLCHTQFGPGELAKHINVGVDDEHLEALGRTLITQLREREGAVREATALEASSSWLKKFCERAGLPANISVRSALAEVENSKRTLADARNRLDALKKETVALEAQGLSVTRMIEISAQLRDVEYPLTDVSREAIDRLQVTINRDLAVSSATLEKERKQADELQRSLEVSLSLEQSAVQDIKAAQSRLKERLATTQSLLAKLRTFSSSFPWPGGRPLAELIVEAESVRKVAAELGVAIARERQAKAAHAESAKRKELLGRRLGELGLRLKRFTEAEVALDKLMKEHSLTDAMKATLQQNRAAIEAIFSRIHSPAEFRQLGSSLVTLIRKENGREASLSEISTGQRAAFALSIFLAQNAQLTVAAPVVLIDDPIAHVDDLNSLSFLDYLREVALTSKRQIFFATANDKLATLFERKFDFLGAEDFRRFNLMREALPVTPLQ